MKINPETYFKIKKNILKKLYAHNAFVKSHLLYERLEKGIPSYLRGFVKEVLSDLIKEQIVLLYGKTKFGNAYQLNIKKLDEIEKIIFSNYSK